MFMMRANMRPTCFICPKKSVLGHVWLIFLKTIMENNFLERFLKTVFYVFRKKKLYLGTEF